MKRKLSVNTISEILSPLGINKGSEIVVAVSGGSDSICLTHLLHSAGYQLLVLHCNFKLRDKESDEDEVFVKHFCNKLNIPVITKSFPAKHFAEEKKISIQEAARELRYMWFEAVRREKSFDFIATAHHADDNAETILHHIIRGCGIEGLAGMKERNGYLIRPLLSFSKDEILAYIKEHDLSYREDSSNEKIDYTRNYIRQEIIPMLTEVNPSFNETFQRNIEHWKEAHNIYNTYISKIKMDLLEQSSGDIKISIGKILHSPAPSSILYECLKDYGFNESQCADIFNSLDGIPGKEFFSTSHRVIKDRSYIIITSLKNYSAVHSIDINTKTVNTGHYKIHIEHIANSPDINLENNKYQYLNGDMLEYPLILRAWKQGDYFYPSGLNKKKKVSDYFTNEKISLVDKERIPILFSGERIVAILGERIDERFKVKPSVKKVLKIWVVKK